MTSCILNNYYYILAAEDVTHSVDVYNKQRDQWFEEMVTSTLALERHEAGRINNIKSLLSRYSKLLEDANTKGNEVNTMCNLQFFPSVFSKLKLSHVLAKPYTFR